MAATSHHTRAGSRNSVGLGEQDLPSGSCNYRDLSTGSTAPVCGCTRFWLNSSHFNINNGASERAWCFCGHHACFHNASSQQLEEREQVSAFNRVDVQEQVEGMNIDTRAGADYNFSTPSKSLTGLGIRPSSRSQSQSINTRVFQALNEFARNQEDAESTTSKLPSTNAPSLIEEPRFPAENQLAQERQPQFRPMAPPVNIPAGPAPRQAEEYSATEVATPSIAGTPDFRAFGSASSGNRPSPGHIQPSRIGAVLPRLEAPASTPQRKPPVASVERAPSAAMPPMSVHEFQNIIQTYGRRLDVLENLSFSQVPVEELQDRFEHFDGRILDLEHWRFDQEQSKPTPDSEKTSKESHRRALPAETSSFGSDGSFDSNAAIHAEAAVLATLAANAETHPRIDALENRVQDLENAAPPSFGRSWHIQVVLLPWGRDLKGIWFSALDATQQSMHTTTQNSEEWTGAQSGPKLSFKSTNSAAWTTESIQAWANEAQEWLSPKACGPSGSVFQRLASRGLVRDITLTAPDARHILHNITEAFRDFDDGIDELFEEMEPTKRYQGLRAPFIPLRKVRKSARLRFLSQAEMVSSASWTASFLDSSVFMKVTDGHRRLYVTTPAAYLQPNIDSAWTWKNIRDLPIFDVTEDEQAAQLAKVAIEACWTYNDRLDQTISLHSSFASHESQWSTRSQFAIDDPDAEDKRPLSPSSDLRPPRQRTVSLPESNIAAEQAKDALPKRRVTSFEPIISTSTYTDEYGVEIASKRRRISMSPEIDRRGVNFTPRWSREPPSPFTSEVTAEARSQGASSSRKRGTTPFAYATPHSNSNFVGRVEISGGDGDTEVATDIGMAMSERAGEEEWEGVGDDGGHEHESGFEHERGSEGDSIAHDQDLDEEDL